MKHKQYLSLTALLILISPLFTKGSIAELLQGGKLESKAMFAWEIEKTNSKPSWKTKRQDQEKV